MEQPWNKRRVAGTVVGAGWPSRRGPADAAPEVRRRGLDLMPGMTAEPLIGAGARSQRVAFGTLLCASPVSPTGMFGIQAAVVRVRR